MLLLDIMMGRGAEGVMIARKMRKDPALRELPVLIITGIREQIAFLFPGGPAHPRFVEVDELAEGLPVARRLFLKAAVLFTNLTTGVRLTDAHNGLRVMTASAARRLEIRQDQMAHASEIIAEIRRHGLRYREVPVTITYDDYSIGKGQRLSNSVRILTDLISGWLSR